MNFFGLWSNNTEEEPENKETPQTDENAKGEQESDQAKAPSDTTDPSELSKLGDDKIFSTIDSETGNVKANLYSPPNLLLNMSQAPKSALKSAYKIDPNKYRSSEAKTVQEVDFHKELEIQNQIEASMDNSSNELNSDDKMVVLSNNLFGLSDTIREGQNQIQANVNIIPNYIITDNEYEDLTKEADRLRNSHNVGQGRPAMQIDTTADKLKQNHADEVSYFMITNLD